MESVDAIKASTNPIIELMGLLLTRHNSRSILTRDIQLSKNPAVKYCNINLRLRQDLKDHLNEESWRKRTTMT